jgi:ATP-dependent RNA helicase RhlE
MGFMPKINKLLEIIPTKRQNLLFSATIPPKVITLSEDFLEYPTVVEITPSATTAETITQELYNVPNLDTKIGFIRYFFEKFPEQFTKVLIFSRTRKIADKVMGMLKKFVPKNKIAVLHANKDQNARTNAMEKFKEGVLQVLVATDVASRGIDVSEVTHVINFDVPIVYEDYVHRIGRTGRANKEGVAITFCTMSEEYHIRKIEQIIQQPIPLLDIPQEVKIFDTPFDERQEMLREIDRQKRKENPNFQGAFHEKKQRVVPKVLTKLQKQKMLDEKSRKIQAIKEKASGKNKPTPKPMPKNKMAKKNVEKDKGKKKWQK